MDKQDVASAHSGILLRLKKESDADTGCNRMTLEDMMLSDIRQSPKHKYCVIPCSGDTETTQNPRDRQ